jgi:hypothetical protein
MVLHKPETESSAATDDRTGKPRDLVRITELNGEFQGKLEKTFPQPGEDSQPKWDKCSG